MRSWLRRHGNLVAFLLGLSAVVLMLVLFEAVFYALNASGRGRIAMRDVREPAFRQADTLLGIKPVPNLRARHARYYQDERLFDVHYTFDDVARRVAPEEDRQSAPEEALLFFGGSFTFGTGVEDSETLPARVAQRLPGARAYNYAFQGYGPQHMLARIETGALPLEVTEQKAFLFFVFIPDHIRRVIGSRKVVCGWVHGEDFPYYDYDEAGTLQRFGSFATGRPWRQRVYGLLHREQCMKFFEMDWPPRVTPEDMKITADVLKKAVNLFARQYGPDRACIVLYPGDVRYSERSMSGRAFIPYLEAVGLPYLDCTDAFDLGAEGYAIPHDGHPTAQAHRIVAEQVAQYLRAMPSTP